MVTLLNFVCMLVWFVFFVAIILANTGYPDLNPGDFTEGGAYLICFFHFLSKLVED